MFDIDLYLFGLLTAVLLPSLTWIVSIFKRNVSIVDSLWSLIFLALYANYFLLNEPNTLRGQIVFILLALWAVRLSVHITYRNWGEPEDPRYQAMRRKYSPNFALKSLGIVFLLQGVLAWIISLPLLAAATARVPLNPLDGVAFALVLFGIAFETVADAQLATFKAKPDSHNQVMDKGLWRYTRHPNYFGEACVWWGFYLFAVAAGGWWAILSPVLMTFLLLRVSGVSLLEEDIAERRPAYRDYVQRTNAFIPGFPKDQHAGKPHEPVSTP